MTTNGNRVRRSIDAHALICLVFRAQPADPHAPNGARHEIPGFPTTLFVLACAAPTSAREVDLLQFANANAVEPESKSTFDTRRGGVAVSTSLLDHFAEELEEQTQAAVLQISPVGGLIRSRVDDLNLPRQRSATAGLACDGASYTPTWWLSLTAETRRSLYFDTVARIACEHGLPTRLLDAVIAQGQATIRARSVLLAPWA